MPGEGKPGAGVVGALLVFMSPVVGRDGTTAYIDVALGTVLFAMFCVLQIWRTERCRRLLIPLGLLAGFAYAVKYLGAAAIPYVLVFVAFHLRKTKQEALRAILIVAGCAS